MAERKRVAEGRELLRKGVGREDLALRRRAAKFLLQREKSLPSPSSSSSSSASGEKLCRRKFNLWHGLAFAVVPCVRKDSTQAKNPPLFYPIRGEPQCHPPSFSSAPKKNFPPPPLLFSRTAVRSDIPVASPPPPPPFQPSRRCKVVSELNLPPKPLFPPPSFHGPEIPFPQSLASASAPKQVLFPFRSEAPKKLERDSLFTGN